MVLQVFAVRDAKSDAFGNPFTAQSVGSAIRSFDDEVNRFHEENMMFRHPEDFSLWQIGSYDNADATFALLNAPKLLISADQVKKGQDTKISKV